jgi:hypothetical protein
MHTYAGITRRRLFILVVPCVLALALVLSACGTNTTTATGAPAGSTATAPGATAVATQSQATADGCPSTTVVTTPPTAANVVLTNTNSGTTITVQKGDLVQVNLPFGHDWQGPLNLSPDLLTAQAPAGYSNAAAKACVWRFVASNTGTVRLSFVGRPICKKGQACPMYIMAIPFTIEIK